MGGENSQIGDYPYMVSVQRNKRHICGGGILDKNHVVTAAHCVAKPNGRFIAGHWQVVGGIDDLFSDSPSKEICDVSVVYVPRKYFDDFKTDLSGDIAILKLKPALNLDENRHLLELKLPYEDKDIDGIVAVNAGFGLNGMNYLQNLDTNRIVGMKQADGKLHSIATQVLTKQQCIYFKKKKISDARFCAKAVKDEVDVAKGTCNGDSGNPLVVDGVLIGVMSAGPRDCDEKYSASVYTRVTYFLNLILAVLDNRPTPLIKRKMIIDT